MFFFVFVLLASGRLASGGAVTRPAGERPTTRPALVPGKEVTHWSGLPVWGEKEARELGFELPFPLGISGNVYSDKQDFDVPKVTLGGKGGGLLDIGGLVQVSKARVEETAWTTRFDSWVLPFLDVYAIAGYVSGQADIQLGPAMPSFLRHRGPKFNLNLDFEGPTVGLGGTLAGGFRPFKDRSTLLFGLADLNFTETFLDFKQVVQSLDPVGVAVFSARMGVRERLLQKSPFGEVHGSLWGGTMYQGVHEVMTGRLRMFDLNFSPHVKGVGPWNKLIGGRLEVGKHLDLTFEIGFGDRESVMFEATFRF